MGRLFFLMIVKIYGEMNFGNNFDNIINVELPVVEMYRESTNTKKVKEWTIIAFMNARNNLAPHWIDKINEMEMVGSSDKVNVVVEIGRISGYSSADGDWTGCRRYYIQKDTDTDKVTSPVLLETSKCDMGSWEYLVDFVKWTKNNYPAKRYILVIWDHGSGWKGKNKTRGISYDEETNHYIKTTELKIALEKIGGVDILAMDACLMQMIEVAYEVKDYVEYIVASEDAEPIPGYPMDRWIKALCENPNLNTKEITTFIVDSYVERYQSMFRAVTQSVVNTKKLEGLVVLINQFIETLMFFNDKANAKTSSIYSWESWEPSHKDFYHFVKLVTDNTQFDEIKIKGKALLDYLKNNVIVYNKVYGSVNQNAYGISIYLPLSHPIISNNPISYPADYDKLLWANDSKWDDLIKWVIKD